MEHFQKTLSRGSFTLVGGFTKLPLGYSLTKPSFREGFALGDTATLAYVHTCTKGWWAH